MGGYHWDSMSGRDQPAKHKATCKLPGLKTDLGNYQTEELARAKVEHAVKYWLSKIDE